MSLVRRKHPLLVLLLVASTLAISPAHPALPQEHPFPWHEAGEDGSVKVNLYVFWAESCPHCHRALRFLDALEQELSWLEVRPLEVSAPENLAAYSALAEQLGADARYVPAFFYCGQSFQGYR
jgi:thiol-disulfide isomerase/thioredoxin